MPQLATYAFVDVQCSITGPGAGPINLGAGAGAAEEGITLAMSSDKNTLTIGADGSSMNSLHAGNPGDIVIRLLKTSPQNFLLMNMYNTQKTSSALWGQNTISMTNPVTGDEFTAKGCAFKKVPDNKNQRDGGMNEWAFSGGNVEQSLAGNLVQVGG